MRDVHLTDDPTSITEVVDDPGFQNPASTAHFNVTIYDSDDETAETYILPIETINVEATKPHPEYTSCTPITRSIMVGDDSNYMTFIPYSDDPTFNHEAQTLHYDHFAWQSMQDPDGISTHLLLSQLDVTNIRITRPAFSGSYLRSGRQNADERACTYITANPRHKGHASKYHSKNNFATGCS